VLCSAKIEDKNKKYQLRMSHSDHKKLCFIQGNYSYLIQGLIVDLSIPLVQCLYHVSFLYFILFVFYPLYI